MIHVSGLQKRYENFLAVDQVSFELQAGEICGLVGPNGAGKTTTLRCLAGLIPPTSGRLEVAGCSLDGDLVALKKQLAYVPDDPPLFDDLSVGGHLDFVGRIYQVDDYHDKAIELLKEFDLIDKYHAGATTLSRGMRQKLAVCCAYLYDPAVLLLDEPLTGLDPPGIRALLSSISKRAENGTTVIISSHLLAMIEEVCTHLLVMQSGQSHFFGTSQALWNLYPQADTLEAAYFAATCGAPVEQQADTPDETFIGPAIIPIADFRAEVIS